jgi:hypothetical protein
VLYRSGCSITGDDVKAFMAAQQRNLDSANDESVSVVSVVTDSAQRMLGGENQSV